MLMSSTYAVACKSTLSNTMWAQLFLLAFTLSSLVAAQQQGVGQCPSVTAVQPKSGLFTQVYTATGSNLDHVSNITASNGYVVDIIEGRGSLLSFHYQTGQVYVGSNEVVTFNLGTNSSLNCSAVPLQIHIYSVSPVLSAVSGDQGQPGTVIRMTGCFPPACGDNSTSYNIKIGGTTVQILPQSLTGGSRSTIFYVRLVPVNESITDAAIVLVSGYGTEYALDTRTIDYHQNGTIVNSITPMSGQTGTMVRISGSNLIGLGGLSIALQSVTIGGTQAIIVNSSQSEINIRVSSNTAVGNQNIILSSVQTSTENGAKLSGPSTNVTGMWIQLEDGVITSLVPPAAQTNASMYVCGLHLLGGGNRITSVVVAGMPSFDFSTELQNLSNPDLPNECIRVTVPFPENDTVAGAIDIISDTGATVSTQTGLLFSYANVASVSPNEGQEYTFVTINGSNLLSGYNSSDNITEILVTFGDVSAAVLSFDSDNMYVRVNPSNVTNILSNLQITVTNYGLSFTVSLSNAWTYLTPGEVSLVSPTFGQYGTQVTINGTNLTGYGSSIEFVRILGSQTGNVSADRYVEFRPISSSASAVSFFMPLPLNISYTGPVDIVLESENGALITGRNAFQYREMGRIEAVSPSQGQGGTYVNITGFELFGYGSNVSAVRFGDIEAEINYSASSPSFISVRVGSNSNLANDTNVIVRIISDTHAIVDSSLSTNWTYLREGVIDSVTPSRGQFGSLITIRGTNLLGGGASVTQIYVDSVAPSIVSFNESEIIVRLGDHLTRNDNFPAGEVYIESDTGAVVRGGTFEQLVPGNITSFSPSTGRQGTIVTVYGFNLRGYGSAITSVSIVGYEALSEVYETDSSDSTLIVRVNNAPNGTSGSIRILIDTGAVIESNEFFTYTEPGSISTVSPSTGAEGVGLLITGTLLQTGDPVITNVTIGGSEVKRIVTYSSTQVTIITGPAPGEGGGSLPIRVISSDGSFIEGGSFTYQNLSLSVVGRTSGQTGTQVTLTAPFPAADIRSVYFDDQEATIITVQEVSENSSIVAVTTPRPQRLGQFTADISIENIRHIFARLIDGFTYLPEGAIYSVTPSFGQSGTRVTLSGERLLGGGSSISSVSIGGITATISNYSDTDISVSLDGNLPNGQGSYSDIYIISNTGATITRLNGFMFIQPGEITSISPSVGQYGTIVTLRGTGLLQGNMDIASVTVAGIEAVLLHTPNNTLIQVQLMPGSEETGSVIITLESGAQISSNGLQFTYIQGNITTVSPSIGTEGTLVSITGTDLRGGGLGVESVSLDGFPAVIISESDTNIVVRASAGVANDTSGSVEIVSNTGSIVSLENSWTYKGLGNITSCLPLSGQQGVMVVIEGIDLIGSSGSEIINVTLAGVPGTIVSQTNTTVQVIAGYSNSSTSGAIVMSVSTGPVLTSSFNWSYYEAVLVSVSPSTGINGTYVLLNGTNIIGEPNSLDTVIGVSFGSIPAFDVVVLSSNLVRARAGHFPTASVPLTVQINSTSGAYLTLSNQWVFREPGQVTDIGPSAAAPGSNVTISGTSLVPGDAAGVTVVTGQTGSFEAWIVNSSVIIFRVGLYVGNDDPNIPLPLLIIASDGSTLQSLAPLFAFEPVNMTVTSVTPVAGGEGSVVVINGTNLLNGGSAIRSVYLAGSLVANFSVNADYTSISVTAGAGDSVEGNVIIENDNGLLYGNYSWAYLPALTSDQVTPTTGRNGTSVIINAGSVPPQYTLQSVTLGGIEASNISSSNGDILVIAPPGTSPGSVVLHFQDGIYLVIPNSWTPQPTVNISSVNTLVGYYGTLVVITGSGFQGIGGASRLIVSSVTIAGFNTRILSQNNTELRVIIDEIFNSSGSGNITGPIIIRNQDDSVYDSSSQDIIFTYLQVSIETVSPSNGQNGTEVVIKGINLLCGGNGISSITLAGIAVSSINMATDSIIKVTAGYSNTETAPSNVLYITDNGAQVTIATSWSYVQPGVISTISPASGQRGTTVTITGQDMLGGGERVMSVILNGIPTMDVVVSHNDFIQVRAGDSIASGPGQVVIIADTGAALYSNVTEVNFQYVSPSQITSFSPLSGQYGTIVTINVTALYPVEAGISTVLLNGIPALTLSSNITSITVSAGRPSFIGSSAGTVSVVSNDGSLTESSAYFTYLLEGEIYSVEPPQGQKDTRVLISGRGLRGGGSNVEHASIAGIPATIVSQSDSMIELIASENKESQSGSVSGNISLVSNTGAEVIRLNAWRYVQTGIVYSLVPDFGQFGTYVSITGERLTAGGDNIVQVFIDDVPSLTVESSNETQVVFRAGQSPSINATTITFISNHGGNLTQSNISWRYEETSVIFSLSPINGTGASIVNITGSNLLGGGSSIVNVVLAGIKVREILNSSDTIVVVEAGFNRDGQPKSGNVTLEADTGALTVLVDGWSYLSECPHGQFGNDSESCMTCHPQCNHCYGPSEFECYACLNFKLTHDDQRFECVPSCPSVSTLDKTCVAECSTFQYRANLNDGYTYCLNCSSLCDPNSGCTGPHPSQCVACSYYKERGECVSQCSTGSYISNKTCLPCSEQCLQSEDCYGPDSTQCNACLNVSITRQSQNKTSYDECIPACPTTYYTDEQNHCQPCHPQCLGGCSGPTSTQCSNCANAFIARPNNTRECVEDCNADSSLKTMYRDTSTSECKACHQYCSVTAGCTGPTAGDCVSCSNFTSGSHVLWTEFIPKLNGECVTLCPNESYYVDLRNGNCELCDPSCFNGCTGPSSGDCIVVLSTESPTLTMTGEPSSAGPFSAGIGTIIIAAVIIVLLIVAFLIVLVILLVKTKGRKDYKIEAEHELEPHSYRRNPISETNLGTNPYITALEASVISEMAPPRPSRSISLENPLFQATNIELLEEDERSFGRSLDRLNEQTSRPISPDHPSSPDADEHSSLLRHGGGDAPPPVPGHQRGSKDVSALRQNSIPASQPQLRPPISSPLNFTNIDDDDDDNDGEMYTEMDPAPHDNLEIMTQDEYVDVDVPSPLPHIDIQQADDAVYEETDSTAHNTSNITGAIKMLPFRQAPLPSPSDSVPPAIPPKPDPNRPVLPPRKSVSSSALSSSSGGRFVPEPKKRLSIDPQTIEEYYEDIIPAGGTEKPPVIIPRQQRK